MPLKVRYGPALPTILALLGASQIFLSFAGRGNTAQLVIGVLGVGLMLLINIAPYFTVAERGLTLYGVGGLLRREFPYESTAALRLDGDRLQVLKDGQWRPIPISKALSHAQDWAALEALLAR